MTNISQIAGGLTLGGQALPTGAQTGRPSFSSLVDQALTAVSDSQKTATAAEAGYTSGLSGYTLGKALVSSDRAAVMWNATIGVRNELVNAYQAVFNMQI
ncbi:flagellar hook-basal body complex protein FliE [Acidocella sp.]|uniref:flagellar hook-basal body complex protein FliE n=1 Tax=Acidocella sp. TaxID=50710 RepID=UPI00262F6432|nr:flagellar hook-basal body complex protein FliE [Acidocella sp.]